MQSITQKVQFSPACLEDFYYYKSTDQGRKKVTYIGKDFYHKNNAGVLEKYTITHQTDITMLKENIANGLIYLPTQNL